MEGTMHLASYFNTTVLTLSKGRKLTNIWIKAGKEFSSSSSWECWYFSLHCQLFLNDQENEKDRWRKAGRQQKEKEGAERTYSLKKPSLRNTSENELCLWKLEYHCILLNLIVYVFIFSISTYQVFSLEHPVDLAKCPKNY